MRRRVRCHRFHPPELLLIDMTARTIDARLVGLLWTLAAFVPLAALFLPALAFQVGIVWLLCATYLWPATALAHVLGIDPMSWSYIVVAMAYCALVGVLGAWLASRLLKRPERVSLRFAVVAVSLVWLPIAVVLGYRFLEYKGLFTRTSACPGNLSLLKPLCGDVTELRVQPIEQFIDGWYLARFTTRPGALATLKDRGELTELDAANVPSSVWSQPPVWWDPDKDDRTRIYATAGFPFEGRGPDGDHYLFIENGRTNQVYVFYKANF
jgi:hypothetical protein